MNMEYRDIEYTVVQGIERRVWKWSAFAAGAQISGQESVRSAAVAAAESAIDLALADPRKLGKPVDEKQVHRSSSQTRSRTSIKPPQSGQPALRSKERARTVICQVDTR
jgi:hypothetical protein